MLLFDQCHKKKWLIGAIAGVAVVFCLAYFISNNYFNSARSDLPQEAEFVKQDAKIKIAANTDLVQRIIYAKCNDEEITHTQPAENLIGLNYQQLQKVYTGWSIDKFDTNEVVLTLHADGFCPEHANNLFVGVKDGYVAVFYGKPGDKAILKEITTLSVTKITPQDLEELQRGVVVESREQLLRTLEGMQAR
ncbi:MAG: BofC C-terminal domain-containing protein [Pelosinus sp.]|nr:BofC C-terminal domain-containing protein [Pelosinus sp.]